MEDSKYVYHSMDSVTEIGTFDPQSMIFTPDGVSTGAVLVFLHCYDGDFASTVSFAVWLFGNDGATMDHNKTFCK